MQIADATRSLCVAAALVAALTTIGTRAQVPAPPTVVFADEFNDEALNRSKWNVIVTGRTVNNEQQAYIDSTETIDFVSGADAPGAERGALRIRARFTPGFKTPEGRSFDFTSGRIEGAGKAEFTYGTASARIKLTAGAGLWPAFWALGAGRWPDTGEMDIMENVGESDWTNVALHGPGYSGNTPLAIRRPFPASSDVTAWHVYSMDWTTNGFVFKVDGEPFYQPTRVEIEKYGRFAYDNPKYLILNLAVGGQYPQSVNKVTAPYPGVAAATVDVIRADKAMMLVDWVRVTR